MGALFFGFDDRVNDLFSIYDRIRLAEAKDDTNSVKNEIAEGLARSCVLLKDIAVFYRVAESQSELRKQQAQEALGMFASPTRLEDFLVVERTILEQSSFTAPQTEPRRWNDRGRPLNFL